MMLSMKQQNKLVFVAELILVSSLDSATVDLTIRPSTLCRIIDNDRKFESVYTAMRPTYSIVSLIPL